MARYKYIDTNPRFLAVDLAHQLLPGTFEHALNHLLDHAIDLSAFDARFRNDATGATASPPAMLLQVVLFAYSRGIVSSRSMARACREHVTFIALCGDTAPHFTTLAHFVSTLGDDLARVFAAVVAICDAQGLLGREMFAIDGVTLPSNASKHRSGTRADFARQATTLEAATALMVQRHRATDALPNEPDLAAKTGQRIARLEQDAAALRHWLAAHPADRRGPKGTLRKSNRTDNDSAKMATGKGVIQGYTGVAAVDARYQIIVDAQAHGTGSEQELSGPVVDALRAVPGLLTATSVITADAGYHSEANLKQLASLPGEALIADPGMRGRDARFATQDRHQAGPEVLHNKSRPAPPREATVYQPHDFRYDAEARTCVCPAGKSLYREGRAIVTNGHIGAHFQGALRDCLPCTHRAHCLRTPDTPKGRHVAFFHGQVAGQRRAPAPENPSSRMRQRLDTPAGRQAYGRRFATVEPVFGNLCGNKGLTRFTLRGRTKVDGQWKLFCLVQNIEKLAHHGYAA